MWKDVTSYSKSDKERIPTAFEAVSGELRIYITCGHIHYKGDWIMHCKALGIDTLHMKTCKTQDDAEKRAIHNARLKLERLIESLDALSPNVEVSGRPHLDTKMKNEMTDTNKTEQETRSGLSDLTVKLERIALTEDELTKLMFASSRDKFINCAYGTHGVDLLPVDGNKWAFEIITGMRSNVKLRGCPIEKG